MMTATHCRPLAVSGPCCVYSAREIVAAEFGLTLYTIIRPSLVPVVLVQRCCRLSLRDKALLAYGILQKQAAWTCQ